MLERFVDLSPGDVVVQNGATSAVGQVIAVCDCAGQVITVTVQAKWLLCGCAGQVNTVCVLAQAR